MYQLCHNWISSNAQGNLVVQPHKVKVKKERSFFWPNLHSSTGKWSGAQSLTSDRPGFKSSLWGWSGSVTLSWWVHHHRSPRLPHECVECPLHRTAGFLSSSATYYLWVALGKDLHLCASVSSLWILVFTLPDCYKHLNKFIFAKRWE